VIENRKKSIGAYPLYQAVMNWMYSRKWN